MLTLQENMDARNEAEERRVNEEEKAKAEQKEEKMRKEEKVDAARGFLADDEEIRRE